MNNLINQTVKRYKLTAKLGSGGMGAVYKGLDTSLKREVAIKIMHSQYAEESTFRQRFLQEATVAANLDHPGIVKVYDFDESQGMLFIVMEFIAGQNLNEWLANQRATGCWISIGDAVELVRQVAMALQHTHECGVLHRDIKPANIMIKNQPADRLAYRPVITDLGLAKLTEGIQITREGESMGTPAYMSPEQALGAKIDARSDVYSLGILLYQLTVGQLPFPAKTISDAIRDHTLKPPPSPTSIQPDFPVELEQIVLKALEKEPGMRFQTAKEFAKALDDFLQDIPEPLAHTALIPNIKPTDLGTIFVRQEDMGEGKAAFEDFDPNPTGISGNSVQVHTPNLTDRIFPLKQGTTTIGRGQNNDIVLEDPAVSHVHAHILYDGVECRVIDQNSANGTFIGQVRLLAGVGETWNPETPLRIGNHVFRLKLSQQPVRTEDRSLNFQPSSVSQGMKIGITLDPAQVIVDAGQSTLITVTLKNLGLTVDHYRISVEGIPANWVTVPPDTIQLMPGEMKSYPVNLRPPRSPQSRAGQYTFFVCTASQSNSEYVKRSAALTVERYAQFTSQLHPQKLRADTFTQVRIENQGNIPETYGVTLEDRGDEISYEVSQDHITVQNGQQAMVKIRPHLRKRRWFGGEILYPFSVKVSPTAGALQSHSGEMISRGLIPVWAPPLVFILCALFVSGLKFLPSILFPKPTATPTSAPGGPVIEEWCIYPETEIPAAFSECPIQVKAAAGQRLVIRWKTSNASKVEITPLGDQGLSGQIMYELTETKTITLKATNSASSTQKAIEIITQASATAWPTDTTIPTGISPTETSFSLLPSFVTAQVDDVQAAKITAIHMFDWQTGWAEWQAVFAPTNYLLRTSDGGTTWRNASPPWGYTMGSRFFALDIQNAWVAVWGMQAVQDLGEVALVWRTNDGGFNWTLSNPIQPGVPGYNILSSFVPVDLFFLDAQNGWLLAVVDQSTSQTVFMVFRTVDGGQTWEEMVDSVSMVQSGSVLPPCGASEITYEVHGIAFEDANNGFLGVSCWMGGGYFTILATQDGGRTWYLRDMGGPAQLPPREQEVKNQGALFCGSTQVEKTPGGLLVQYTCTYDAGSLKYTYLSLSAPGSGSWIGWGGETASFIDRQEGFSLSQLGQDGYRTLSVTHDGGVTWQAVRPVEWPQAHLNYLPGSQWFALGWKYGDQSYDFALMRTDNSGLDWTRVEGVVR